MRKVEEFITKEKASYGDVYSRITYAQSELEPFLDSKILKQRKYVSHLPVLSRYMELMDSVHSETKNFGIMDFLKDDRYISVLQDYKRDHFKALNQLEKCYKCECLKCPKECEFDSCLGCTEGGSVVQCDHTEKCIVCFDYRVISLHNDSTDGEENFMVLAIMQDISLDKMYIIVEGLLSKDKYVLYYFPGISETTYGEITDADEFDRVVASYQSLELI